jgi:hypothetical protein
VKSYKTTLAGIAAICTAAAAILTGLAEGGAVDWTSAIAAIVSGVGLMFARDNSVTSEQAGAK